MFVSFPLSVWLSVCTLTTHSNTLFDIRYGTKTSQCATSSSWHLNLWGSKIISVYIILHTHTHTYIHRTLPTKSAAARFIFSQGVCVCVCKAATDASYVTLAPTTTWSCSVRLKSAPWRGRPRPVRLCSPSQILLIFDILDERQLRHRFLHPQGGEPSGGVGIPALPHQFAHHAQSLVYQQADSNIRLFDTMCACHHHRATKSPQTGHFTYWTVVVFWHSRQKSPLLILTNDNTKTFCNHQTQIVV